MNIFFISLFLLSAPTVSQVVKADNFSHDWENHHVLHINRLPARAAFVPYRQKVGDSSYSLPIGKIVDTVLPFMCRQAILSVLTHLV